MEMLQWKMVNGGQFTPKNIIQSTNEGANKLENLSFV